MIQFVYYNFLSDLNALDPYPTVTNELETVVLQNAIFNDLSITKDVDSPYSMEVQTVWDIYTILLATFDNTLNAGSITDYSVGDIDSIRIKRRKLGEFNWETIYERKITNSYDLVFSGEDNFAMNETEYEYAWVPVVGNVEGNYSVSSIESKFKGVFIADADTIYKFAAGVGYGPSEQTQLVATYNPLGKKYPVYVSNGATNYQTGSLTAKIIGNYENTHVFNRKEMVEQKNNLLKWLTNKRAKVLKDFNGNIWLIYITGSPSITYNTQWGNNMMEVSFQYGEIGDIDNSEDMRNLGLWPLIPE
jgi:hypothetical protein